MQTNHRAHTPSSRGHLTKLRRHGRLRKLSSNVFCYGDSPMPTTSAPILGPATLVLGQLGQRAVKVETRLPQPDELDEALLMSADPHNYRPVVWNSAGGIGLESLFLSDVTSAGHFLAQVQSFMLNCDMLKQRKEEVEKRRQRLEQEKEVIAKEMRDTTFKLFNAFHFESDCKNILCALRISRRDIDLHFTEIKRRARALFGNKALNMPNNTQPSANRLDTDSPYRDPLTSATEKESN